jgi:DNA-binding NtrC family response regulator
MPIRICMGMLEKSVPISPAHTSNKMSKFNKEIKRMNMEIRKMRKLRIVIIDDDVLILHSLSRWLSKKGYEVLTFNEPQICPLDEKKTDNCIKENLCADIFITDCQMPKINGVELLQKQSQRGCKLSIRNKAIISGSTDDEVGRSIEKLGCSFFKKPIELSELHDWLNKCEKRINLSLPLAII